VNFLALVGGLALQQLLGPGSALQRDHWFVSWRSWLARRGLAEGVALAAAVLLPALFAAWLLALASRLVFGLPALLLGAVLLVYALGRGDPRALAARLRRHCAAGDAEGAWLEAAAALPAVDEGEAPRSAVAALHRMREALVYQSYQGWFAPVFFFVLGGPAAALAYRLLQLHGGAAANDQARRVLHWVDWLPARILALSFAVTGDFVAVQRALDGGSTAAAPLLAATGRAALGLPASATADAGQPDVATAFAGELDGLQALLTRSAGGWLILVAIAYLFL
jgi:AmpE protein